MTRPTIVYQAVAQIIEWTFGRTHIEFGVDEIKFSAIGDNTNRYTFQISTNIANVGKIKHPLGLAVETIQLTITGACRSLVVLGHKDQEIISVDLEDLTEFNVREDQGGYSTVSVQNVLGLYDGEEKLISRHFVFRNNLMHAIR